MVDRCIVAAEELAAEVHHGALSALQALQLCSFETCLIFVDICCSKVNFEEREVFEVWHKPMAPQEQATYHKQVWRNDETDS